MKNFTDYKKGGKHRVVIMESNERIYLRQLTAVKSKDFNNLKRR